MSTFDIRFYSVSYLSYWYKIRQDRFQAIGWLAELNISGSRSLWTNHYNEVTLSLKPPSGAFKTLPLTPIHAFRANGNSPIHSAINPRSNIGSNHSKPPFPSRHLCTHAPTASCHGSTPEVLPSPRITYWRDHAPFYGSGHRACPTPYGH